jgi:hypothetical protein
MFSAEVKAVSFIKISKNYRLIQMHFLTEETELVILLANIFCTIANFCVVIKPSKFYIVGCIHDGCIYFAVPMLLISTPKYKKAYFSWEQFNNTPRRIKTPLNVHPWPKYYHFLP